MKTHLDRVIERVTCMNKESRFGNSHDGAAEALQMLDKCRTSARGQRRSRTRKGRRPSLNSGVGGIRGHIEVLKLVIQMGDRAEERRKQGEWLLRHRKIVPFLNPSGHLHMPDTD